jgi:hypothetical protein
MREIVNTQILYESEDGKRWSSKAQCEFWEASCKAEKAMKEQKHSLDEFCHSITKLYNPTPGYLSTPYHEVGDGDWYVVWPLTQEHIDLLNVYINFWREVEEVSVIFYKDFDGFKIDRPYIMIQDFDNEYIWFGEPDTIIKTIEDRVKEDLDEFNESIKEVEEMYVKWDRLKLISSEVDSCHTVIYVKDN